MMYHYQVLNIAISRRILPALLLVGLLSGLCARELSLDNWSERGQPYLVNYGPNDYGGIAPNNAIVQAHSGVMYVGNQSALMSFDGVRWRKVKDAESKSVKSMAVASSGRIYIGSIGDIGYLQPDSVGRMTFRSLVEQIPADRRFFGDVRHTLVANNSVYFSTRRYLFRWKNQQFTVKSSGSAFGKAFQVNGRIYILEKEIGLQTLQNDSLRLIPGGERFREQNVHVMLPFNHDNILIGTRAAGFFLFDGSTVRSFDFAASGFLKTNSLTCGALVSADQGLFAFGTVDGGVAIVNRKGDILQVLNKASGLRSDFIRNMYCDKRGVLWLLLENGISMVDILSPLSFFTDSHGLRGFTHNIIRHQGILYARSNYAVYYLEKSSQVNSFFRPVKGVTVPPHAMISTGEDLLLATSEAIYEISGEEARPIPVNWSRAISLMPSQDPRMVYVGLWNGLALLRRQNGRWVDGGRVEKISEPMHHIAESGSGKSRRLWLSTPFQNMLRLDWPADEASFTKITRFDGRHGLPPGPLRIYRANRRLIFATFEGLRYFDEGSGSFKVDSTFGETFADSGCSINYMQQDFQQGLWINYKIDKRNEISLLRLLNDGRYAPVTTPAMRKIVSRSFSNWTIHPQPDSIVWFGGRSLIVRYNPQKVPVDRDEFPVMIRKVVVNGDSLIYGGTRDSRKSGARPIRLRHRANTLSFEFAAVVFDAPRESRYQVYLEGFDYKPSAWLPTATKEYTGLPAGSYSFRVNARDVYGQAGQPAEFNFEILPPWYLTWWAKLIYGILAIALVAALVKIRVRQLQIKTRELEAVVAERTETVRAQAEKLRELNLARSRFFANISHEFRTPLTLILGPLEDLIGQFKDAGPGRTMKLMRRNARRLLQLINQLLDLSRLESGRLTLQAARGDFENMLRGIVMSFSSLAEQQDIRLDFVSRVNKEILGQIYFDRDKIEKIFVNLLSNAFKFTPSGGKITMTITISNRQSSSRHWASICIEDTGSGIAAADLPHVFDRYFQAGSSGRADLPGSGIGLALTRELVELHHGTIAVSSLSGEGTTFTVDLPIGPEPFKPNEIEYDDSDFRQDSVGADSFETMLPQIDPGANAVASPEKGGVTDPDATIILIVDDHPEVRRYIMENLSDDYLVREADNGQSGLAAAVEIVPDLIISDVMMPEMDGNELCHSLKSNLKTSHIPVILLTARAGQHDKLTGLQTGADDYLVKPFNSKELQIRVANLIESRRQLRERFRLEAMLEAREVENLSADEVFLQKCMQAIEAHLEEEKFGAEAFSDAMNMGRRQLHRKLRALTGQSPTDLIIATRLQRARKLLEARSGTVTEVAFAVGFNNLSYFARSFRKAFGESPSAFLKKQVK